MIVLTITFDDPYFELGAQCRLQHDEQLEKVGFCEKHEYWPSDTHRSHIMINVKDCLYIHFCSIISFQIFYFDLFVIG